MKNIKTLTVNEALRFANHDFLNQLQLIKMNLDLGRTDSIPFLKLPNVNFSGTDK